MRSIRGGNTASPPLHTHEVVPHARLTNAFAGIYICALVALFYHHLHTLLSSATTFLRLSFIFSDAVFAFLWATTLGLRIRPIKRKEHVHNLLQLVEPSEFPALDVLICTADPYKEPPICVVNTILSVMAYDYPAGKITVYVSDDGGSKLTLFAFMEAAKFAAHWLPFCREKNTMERSPEGYFASESVNYSCPETEKIKMMYDNMKIKVESVIHRGIISEEHITSEYESRILEKWTPGFTPQDHPTIIQVLLDSSKDKDNTGHGMPSLVYVSREKKMTVPHHFKGGALNALLRVSATMSNAPLLLTLDCDMVSDDPKTVQGVLCYFMDPSETQEKVAYVQFPQRFKGVNKDDIYGVEHMRLFRINKSGMDGHRGPNYSGTGCFLRRRAFFGGPLIQLSVEIPELSPDHLVNKPITSEAVLTMARHVASCTYEEGTNWGAKMGIRHGSLVEDFNTSYHMQCQGWTSLFSNPERAPFLGDAPITLYDALAQDRRWAVGQLDIGFSRYCPVTFGAVLGLPMVLCLSHYSFWTLCCFPVTIYAIIPSLALLNRMPVFPQVSNPSCYLYIFLVLGAYGQDLFEFVYFGGTLRRWYNEQRMWMIKGVSAYLFATVDVILKKLGMTAFGFNLTSKVVDDEQSRRYEQGLFEFGVASSMFVPMTTAAILNFSAFTIGFTQGIQHGNWDEMFLQLSFCGFVTLNSWPIYEAMILRSDTGKMPVITTLVSISLAWAMYTISYLALKT